MIRLIHLRTPFLDDQSPRNLQDQVTDEENPHSEAKGRFRKSQGREIFLHLELRKADVDAVDIGDDIAQEQNRQEPDVRLSAGPVQRTGSGGRGRHKDAHGWPGE